MFGTKRRERSRVLRLIDQRIAQLETGDATHLYSPQQLACIRAELLDVLAPTVLYGYNPGRADGLSRLLP